MRFGDLFCFKSETIMEQVEEKTYHFSLVLVILIHVH